MRPGYLSKICPVNDEAITAIVIYHPDNNAGLIVMCLRGELEGCPHGRKYICMFPLNPERRYAIGDPRNLEELTRRMREN